MIRSITISVQNPLRVAKALAEIWEGHLLPFLFLPHTYIVLAKDEWGTSIEIYPADQPPEREDDQAIASFYSFLAERPAATPEPIPVSANLVHLRAIAQREGWHLVVQGRIVELWLTSQLKLELLPRGAWYAETFELNTLCAA